MTSYVELLVHFDFCNLLMAELCEDALVDEHFHHSHELVILGQNLFFHWSAEVLPDYDCLHQNEQLLRQLAVLQHTPP